MIYSTQRLEIISKCQKKTFLKSLFETRFKMSQGKNAETGIQLLQFDNSPLLLWFPVSTKKQPVPLESCTSREMGFARSCFFRPVGEMFLWWSSSSSRDDPCPRKWSDLWIPEGFLGMFIGTEGASLGVRAAPVSTKDLYLHYLIVSYLKVTHWKCWTSKASKPRHKRLHLFAERAKEIQ